MTLFAFRRLIGILPVTMTFFSGCSAARAGQLPAQDPTLQGSEPTHESSRVMIDNVENGLIRGSHDMGKTWTTIGHVLTPVRGGIWLPSANAGVKAYDFLRGPSNVFATAVNNLHLRFSDPEGYKLPADTTVAPILAHGVTYAPKEEGPVLGNDVPSRMAITDIPGGTGIFGPEWSPKIGSKVLMGDGVNFRPISYDVGPTDSDPSRAHILIITEDRDSEIEYVEFENHWGGRVMIKRFGESAPVHVAKVLRALEGIGRFEGSEYCQIPGVMRANHAGVFDLCTTDINVDNNIPANSDLNELRGGWQIVPSFHWRDESMLEGRDHPYVYMVVGLIQDPPELIRYDEGIEGQYPLFYQGFRAGTGKTLYQFRNDSNWYELSDAVAKGKFVTKNGTVMHHMRGYVRDAMIEVTGIRFVTH